MGGAYACAAYLRDTTYLRAQLRRPGVGLPYVALHYTVCVSAEGKAFRVRGREREGGNVILMSCVVCV